MGLTGNARARGIQDAIPSRGRVQWNNPSYIEKYGGSLFCCCQDIGSCCCGYWFPCCLWGENSEWSESKAFQDLDGMGAFVAGCACCCAIEFATCVFGLGWCLQTYLTAESRAAAERKLGREQYQGFSPDPCECQVICIECCCMPCSLCQVARAIKGYERAKAAGMITTTTTTYHQPDEQGMINGLITSQPPAYRGASSGNGALFDPIVISQDGKAGAFAI